MRHQCPLHHLETCTHSQMHEYAPHIGPRQALISKCVAVRPDTPAM
jgi:hypothetical protein